MESIVAEITKLLGIPGLWIAYLIYQNRELQSQNKQLSQQLSEVTEKRVTESREQYEVTRGSIAALQTFNQRMGSLVEAVSELVRKRR